MAGSKAAERPLSPHLQIYRWPLPMMMSILHRITGVGLYFGTLLIAWWLIAAGVRPQRLRAGAGFISSWFGRLILFGYTWALIHHMLGGIRHLIWDTGRGFEPKEREWLSLATCRIGDADTGSVDRRVSHDRRRAMSEHDCARRWRASAASARPRRHRAFLAMRLTSVASIPLTIAFVIIVVICWGAIMPPPMQILGAPLVAIVMLLFILTNIHHMWHGMQVVIEDYVHDELAKLSLLMANTFFSSRSALACVYALLKLSFGV